MPDKHEKLPYVFVEIDEPEEPEVIKPYIYDDPPYPPYGAPYADPYPGAIPQSFASAPYPGAAPSPYPLQGMPPQANGYAASRQTANPFGGDPRGLDARSYASERFDDYDMDDEEFFKDEDYISGSYKGFSDDKNFVSSVDLGDDEDFEDGYDDLDYASFDEPESEELDLKTVVVPVFKNMDLSREKAPRPHQAIQPFSQQVAPQMPQQIASLPQMPLGQAAPIFQALPYAYNPYRVPFVNAAWVQPMPVPVMGPIRNPQYRVPVQQAQMRQAPLQRNAGMAQPRQQASSGMRPAPVSSASRKLRDSLPDIENDPRASDLDGLTLPAEARAALSSLDRPAAPIKDDVLARPQVRQAHAADVVPSQPKAKNTIVVGPNGSSSSGQTITANTDSVSVSVKVMPPKKAENASSGVTQVNSRSSSAAPTPAPSMATTVPLSQGTGLPEASAANAMADAPNAQAAKKRASEPKRPKETFEEKAMRENAEKTHTSLVESGAVDEMGKPLLDANAIETSEMFSAPATSMDESMHGFFKSSGRKRALLIVLLALIVAAVVAAVVCLIAVWTGIAVVTHDENDMLSIALSGSMGT